MMSSDIGDLLECSVCLESLGTNHKVLPCQHTFCTPCLHDVRAKRQRYLLQLRQSGQHQPQQEPPDPDDAFDLICPECRTPCAIPLERLPTNVILNRILGGMKSRSASSPVFPREDSFSKLAGSPVEPRPKIPGNLATNPFLVDELPSPSSSSSALSEPKSPVPLLPPKPGTSSGTSFFSTNTPAVSMAPSRPPPPQIPRPKPAPKLGVTPSAGHQIYRALYDFNPTKPDELLLKKNELYIVIEKCQDGWFKGSPVQGIATTGVFPGNYVQHIQQDAVILPPKKIESHPKSSSQLQSKTQGDVVRAPGDLIDFSNDMAEIFGTTKSIVPPNASTWALSKPDKAQNSFQELQQRRSEEAKRLNAVASSRRAVPAANPLPNATTSSVPNGASPVPNSANQSSVSSPAGPNGPVRYRCMMSYPASSQYELDLKDGDVVLMIKMRDDGWCKGTLERTGQTGLFPFTFVQRIS